MSFPYSIKKSARAKSARIIVAHEKVEVVIPVRMSLKVVEQFVMAKQPWIEATLQKLRHRALHATSLAPPVYQDGVLIPFEGNYYPLRIMPTSLQKIKLEFVNQFDLYVPQSRNAGMDSETIKAVLTRWFKEEAKRKVQRLVEQHAQHRQLFPRLIRIKTQKSRWGSCGAANDININWLLIFAPPAILEYVVVHELCHIQQRNHSANFWALVAEHLPDYQQQRHWLKQYGASLMKGL